MRQRLSIEDYIAGILAGDRITLSQAITVTESRLSADKELASAILKGILPHSGHAFRPKPLFLFCPPQKLKWPYPRKSGLRLFLGVVDWRKA